MLPADVEDVGKMGSTLYYKPKGKDWVDENEARKMQITPSTIPQRNTDDD